MFHTGEGQYKQAVEIQNKGDHDRVVELEIIFLKIISGLPLAKEGIYQGEICLVRNALSVARMLVYFWSK